MEIKIFLIYLAVIAGSTMTVPAAFYATRSVISAISGIVVAALVSLKYKSLIVVAVAACVTVFLVELVV